MIPTIPGAIVVVVGLALMFQPPIAVLLFTCICTLLPAASAVDLPALGGSSIPPAMLALGFLVARLLQADVRGSAGTTLAFNKNAWLLVFCAYCAATAYVLPKIFAGQIYLIPMGKAILGFQPLHQTPQNTTQAVYMLGTAVAAIGATILATRPGSVEAAVKVFVVIAWVHVATGLADVIASAAGFHGLFDIVRNGSYAQLDQEQSGFHRISGMAPEPSTYAAVGGVYFVLMSELWLRRIAPRRTGPAALAVMALLALSTSSTAYGTLVVYGALLGARVFFAPGSVPMDRVVTLVVVSILASLGALLFVLASPHRAEAIQTALADLTVHKTESLSGAERTLWANQGWTAMKQTHGLGVGVGSFRSSNLFTAILGSVGPAGLVAFLMYCLQVAKFGRRASYVTNVDPRAGAGAAAGWTAIVSLAPAALIGVSADPGLLFAIMCGLSLGWRSGVISRPTLAEARGVGSFRIESPLALPAPA